MADVASCENAPITTCKGIQEFPGIGKKFGLWIPKPWFQNLEYSETPPYGHLDIIATFFWPPGKMTIHFLVKNPFLIRPISLACW